jgi:hypothetical protein
MGDNCMNESGINKLYLGFIFIMLSFRIQGFDILPDVVGYLFFASAFSILTPNSTYFSIAAKYNIPMIILSIFSIYQSPVQGAGIHLGPLGMFSIPLIIISVVLNLLVAYNLFMGIKEMAEKREQFDLARESDERWNQYKMLQIAIIFSFVLIFIPPLALIYIIVLFIITIILTIAILSFLKKCSKSLGFD